MKLQKLGGIAALVSVGLYIVCAVYSSLILPSDMGNNPEKIMAAMSTVSNEYYMICLMFMVSSILGLAMFAALHERMHANAPYLSKMMLMTSSASTVIWITEQIVNINSIGTIVPTRDLSAFRAFWAISHGLHFTGGHANGWACLFAGCAILTTASFARLPGCLFFILGILWIPTFFLVHLGFRFTIPLLIFLCCVTLIWIGIEMLRQKHFPATVK